MEAERGRSWKREGGRRDGTRKCEGWEGCALFFFVAAGGHCLALSHGSQPARGVRKNEIEIDKCERRNTYSDLTEKFSKAWNIVGDKRVEGNHELFFFLKRLFVGQILEHF